MGAEAKKIPPHRRDPVEELYAGGHRNEHRRGTEERIAHGIRCEHVMGPDRKRIGPDQQSGKDEPAIPE